MFDRVIGHRGVLSLFTKMLIEESPNGVFLFNGPKSVGKHTIAREFAKLAVCSGSMDPGCACINCRLFPSIPDFLSIDDIQKIIKVSEAKDVDSFLSLAPYSAKRRVVLIDDADRMNRQASYSLLKTLEDCGTKAVIILVTSQESKISPAIVSRCVPIQFGPLSQQEVSEILSRQGHPRASVEDVCRASPYFSGSVLRDFSIYSKYLRKMPSILKSFSLGSEDEVLSLSSESVDSGHTVYFVEAMISSLCDIMKTHYDRPGDVASLSCSAELESLTETWPVDVCIASCAKLGEVIEAARSPLNLKVGPRLQVALSWMSMYVAQATVRKRMTA